MPNQHSFKEGDTVENRHTHTQGIVSRVWSDLVKYDTGDKLHPFVVCHHSKVKLVVAHEIKAPPPTVTELAPVPPFAVEASTTPLYNAE